MKPSLAHSKRGLSKTGVAAAVLAFTAVACFAPMHYAFADDRAGNHEHDFDHDHDRDQDQSRGHEWRDKQVQGHRYRVCAPPSLYYPQPASTGITLVFPIDIR